MPSVTAKTVRVYEAHQNARMQNLEGLELASFWRAIAFSIDFILASAVFLAGIIALIKLLPMSWLEGHGEVHIKLDFFHNWYSVVYFAVFFGLSQYFGNGRTLGKRIMEIRVVALVHHDLSLWHAIGRSLGYGASALELGPGFVQFFIERNRHTVHDSIAETILVGDAGKVRR